MSRTSERAGSKAGWRNARTVSREKRRLRQGLAWAATRPVLPTFSERLAEALAGIERSGKLAVEVMGDATDGNAGVATRRVA